MECQTMCHRCAVSTTCPKGVTSRCTVWRSSDHPERNVERLRHVNKGTELLLRGQRCPLSRRPRKRMLLWRNPLENEKRTMVTAGIWIHTRSFQRSTERRNHKSASSEPRRRRLDLSSRSINDGVDQSTRSIKNMVS